MADVIGCDGDVANRHLLVGLKGDEAVERVDACLHLVHLLLLDPLFPTLHVVEKILAKLYQQRFRECSDILRNTFLCHFGFEAHVVAVGMGVEDCIHTIKDGVDILSLVQGVVVPDVPFGEVVAEVYQYLSTRGGCYLRDAPANLVDSSMDGDGHCPLFASVSLSEPPKDNGFPYLSGL